MKKFRIIINDMEVHTNSSTVSYEILAFLAGFDVAEDLLVTYKSPSEGAEIETLTAGDSIAIEEKMTFTVAAKT